MTGTDTKKALGAPRNKMALLNEVAAAPNTTHAGGQYGDGGNILTQQALLTKPGAFVRPRFVAAAHPGAPPMGFPPGYGVYGGMGLNGPAPPVPPPRQWPGSIGSIAELTAHGHPILASHHPAASEQKRPWVRLMGDPPDATPQAGAGSDSSGGNVLTYSSGPTDRSSLGGSGASENTFDSYGRGGVTYPPGFYPPAGYGRSAPAGPYAAHAPPPPPPKPVGFLVEAGEDKKRGEDSPQADVPTETNGTGLVVVHSSAAPAPETAHNPLAHRTKSLLGAQTFAEVQTMLLRQQGAYERQLLDLHRVVRVQSDIICSITKQDGVDSKDDGATDARNFREKSKSPDSDQSKELKLGVKSTQGSGAGSGDGSGQGSGGGSGQGSGQGSGSDVSDGDKGPIRRPILKGRRSPRGGGKNKRATISPEVDKIESRGGQDNGARVVHTHTTEEGDGTHHAAAPEAAPREEAEAGGARAAPETDAQVALTKETGDADVSNPNLTNSDPLTTNEDPLTTEDADAPTEGAQTQENGPFAAIFSVMAEQAVIKQAAQKAFDEQSLQSHQAYALATRPWREEGGGETLNPGDTAALPSHHQVQEQHQAAAAAHHEQVQAAYHASRQRSLQSLHQHQQQHEQRYYHDQWVAWYSQQYAAHVASITAQQQQASTPVAPGPVVMGPPQPKPPAAQVQAGVAHAWPPAVHTPGAPGGDWFQRTGRDVNVLRGQEVTQVIGGHPAGAHHHMASRAHGHTQAHGYHFPVPQPPGAMFPHPSFPESRSQGPAPTGYLGIYPKSPAETALTPGGPNMVNRRTMSGQQDGSKNGHKIRIDDKKGSRSVTNKGKRSKGTKRGASSGRKSADGLTEDIDDAGSDSMMTGQPGQSDGGEVDGHGHHGRGGGGVGGALGTNGSKKDVSFPSAPLTKKLRSGQPKQGPKDRSAADILISIMKA